MPKDQAWTLRDRLRATMVLQLLPRASVTEKWNLYSDSARQWGDCSRTLDAFAKQLSRIKDQLEVFDISLLSKQETTSPQEVTGFPPIGLLGKQETTSTQEVTEFLPIVLDAVLKPQTDGAPAPSAARG